MTVHPNRMTAWAHPIECQRGHGPHRTRRVTVSLGAGHGYHDYPLVPDRFSAPFLMDVWDTDRHPVDHGPYCPAADAVSATIVSHGIWEPRETILALQAFSTARPDDQFYDMGSQIGWFSLLAASYHLGVTAFEADPENRRIHSQSNEANGWGGYVGGYPGRIGSDTPEVPVASGHVRLVKMDLEGAERDGWRIIQPAVRAGLVDFLLVEVSPVFDAYYPALVNEIIAAGYRAYTLPPKQQPPVTLDDPERDMVPYRFDTLGPQSVAALVASWQQEDCWFVRFGTKW